MLLTAQPSPLSDGDALSLLLGVEGFLFAAVTLAVTLSQPAPKRPQRFEMLKPEWLMIAAVAVLAVVGLGGVAAWTGLRADGGFDGRSGCIVGAALLVGIIGMPLIALLLVLGSLRAKVKT